MSSSNYNAIACSDVTAVERSVVSDAKERMCFCFEFTWLQTRHKVNNLERSEVKRKDHKFKVASRARKMAKLQHLMRVHKQGASRRRMFNPTEIFSAFMVCLQTFKGFYPLSVGTEIDSRK